MYLCCQHSQDDDGFVVEVFGAALEVGDGFEDGLAEGFGGGAVGGGEDGGETVAAEGFAGEALRVGDAVGDEDDAVAGVGVDGELLVLGLLEHAEGEAGGEDGGDLAGGGDVERLGGAGVGDGAWSARRRPRRSRAW